jgi:DNA-binding response OmpR family regulator
MRIRVLIADPDQALLSTYCDFLSRQGFDLATATTGPDCVTLLREFKPDVLVLEPDLPDDWGTRVLDLMHDGRDVPCVPVVVLTRNERATEHQRVGQVHVKPVSLKTLAETIRLTAQAARSS